VTDESVHDERRVPTSTGRRGWVGVDRNWLTDDRLSDSGLRLMLWLESHTDEYLAAMNVKRTAEALGWKRDRVRRHLDALTDLGLISVGQEARKYGGTVSRITLHLDAWTDGPRRATDPETDGPRRASAVAHGEARAVAYREAPTNSTNSVSTAVEEHTAGGVVSVACPTFEQWYRWWPKKQGRAAAEKRWAKMTSRWRRRS
jgi:hypothetical protein